jgi:CheY-like chemotaxis protein
MMPGIDGFETCRRLKANEVTQDIPVIFMTALAEAENKVRGFQAGAVDYVTKPMQQEEVLARVTTHLKIRDLTRRLQERNEDLQELSYELLGKNNRLLKLTDDLEDKNTQLEKMADELRVTNEGLLKATDDLRDANIALSKRAVQLEASNQVGQQVTLMLDLDELLATVVKLIQSKFGYYFVGVLLLNESKERLVLQASTGGDESQL